MYIYIHTFCFQICVFYKKTYKLTLPLRRGGAMWAFGVYLVPLRLNKNTLCCSVLQCVAVCCSVLQCVAVCRSVLQCVAVCYSVLRCVAVSLWLAVSTFEVEPKHPMLQCVAVRCSLLQYIAVCCSVLQWAFGV